MATSTLEQLFHPQLLNYTRAYLFQLQRTGDFVTPADDLTQRLAQSAALAIADLGRDFDHMVSRLQAARWDALTVHRLDCDTSGVIIFARTQLGADRIAGELRDRGVLAAALHGGLSQSVRNRVMEAYDELKQVRV